jgi:UDP-glucose 4-epimerase
MKILITGGAGFIGSNLADRLVLEGHDISIIDNLASGRLSNLSGHAKDSINIFSIYDKELVLEVFDNFKPEVVIHAAASYKDPNDWEEDLRTNVSGTKNIIEACLRSGTKRVIYFNTALCYGINPLEQPLTVNSLLNPTGSSYAITKTAGESFLFLSGLEVVSFRLANAYGPRNLSGPLPTFYKRLSEGKDVFVMNTRRDFVYIDDLVDLIITSISMPQNLGVYHISTGSDFSIKELFDELIDQLKIEYDKPLEVRERQPDDAYTILLDPKKTHEDFGWTASTPLKLGVRNAIEWYRANGLEHTYTHLKPLTKE